MIRRVIFAFIAFLSLFLVFSCGGKKAPPPKPEWLFEKDAITLRMKADQMLNMSEGTAHTLMVCIYQVRDEAMLSQLATNEDGIYQLLDCETFDSSIRNAKRLIIHPGQDLTIVMDRLAGTQKISLVAGYAQLQKERMIRIVDIPVLISKDEKSAVAGALKAVVNLGSEQIAAIQSY